ncbi:MAG: hypothetical protein FWG20_00620, partial [Candidatus Cloacimonetes bacterium]|nr:hypothetical protein [Candidatus Cloacimonadota bacterium]
QEMLKVVFANPEAKFEEILLKIGYKKSTFETFKNRVTEAQKEYENLSHKPKTIEAKHRWIMGRLKAEALGNIDLKELCKYVQGEVK